MTPSPADLKALSAPLDDSVARAGEWVGPYRLVREIGRGGMGTVWLAERADGTMRRHVALKLPRLAWGAGLAERMARERDIGALLEHPHIARLYDAGVDRLGRPYLAFEYIDGVPLDAWCESKSLSVRARLGLFVQIARAVAYAHGRLVVHRDLKPSNVLVTPDGGAHLLDFGIATLLHESRDEPAPGRPTRDQGRVLTPRYASPEQLHGDAITVASDVYSLGVLLHEMLTGRHPQDTSRAGHAARAGALVEGEPPPASSRARDKATRLALRGDLDAIVAKAMKWRADQRYATAHALADDIERHLGGEVVRARPDSAWYRMRTFVRRHRFIVLTAAAVVASILAASVATVVQVRLASRAAERQRLATEFVADLFRVEAFEPSAGRADFQAAPGGMLDRAASLIETRFAREPALRTELYGAVARLYAEIGVGKLAIEYAMRHLRGLERQGAGRDERALALLLLADAHSEEGHHAEAESSARSATELSAIHTAAGLEARAVLAGLLVVNGKHAEARRIVESAERVWPLASSAPTAALAKLADAKGRLMEVDNRFDEAEALWLKAIAMAVSAEGPRSRTANPLRLRLAEEEASRNRVAEARSAIDDALHSLDQAGDAGRVQGALAAAKFAAHSFALGQMGYAAARARIQQSQATIERWGAALPPRVAATVDSRLGFVALAYGEVDEAERWLRRSAPVIVAATDSLAERRLVTANMAKLELMKGRHREADGLLRQRLALRVQMGDGRTPFAAYDWVWIAHNLSMGGDPRAAEQFLQGAPSFAPLAADRVSGAAYANAIAQATARVRLDRGDVQGALAALPMPYGLKPGEDRSSSTLLPFALRGEVLCAAGKPAQGLPIVEASIHAIAPDLSEIDPGLARLRAIAGLCALSLGDRATASRMASLSRHAFQRAPDVSGWYRLPLVNLEGRLAPRLGTRRNSTGIR